jgi:predicted anti-sigma-YlaC factor YlaD
MTAAPGCAAARELAPDLVVGILDGAERAEVLEHVHHCSSCQAYASELTSVADALVHFAPEIEPPAGFSGRVIATMRRPRRVRRRLVVALAAAVAAAAIVSVVAVRVIDADRAPSEALVPTIARTAMVGSDGVRVGEVVTATSEGTALAVTVDYAVDDGLYDVVLRSRDASDVLGEMQISDGKGAWSGRVGDGRHPDASVDLVDAAGAPVCSAALGDV